MQSNKLEQSPRTNVKRYKKQHVEAICVGLQYGHKTCLPLINRTVTVTEKMRVTMVGTQEFPEKCVAFIYCFQKVHL